MKKKILILSIFIIPFFVAVGIQKIPRKVHVAKVTWINNRGGTGDCITNYDSGDNQDGDCNNIPLQIGENVITLMMMDIKGKRKSGKFVIDYDGKDIKKTVQFR